MYRLIAGVFLGLWLAVVFALTLSVAHPGAGQVINDNPTPFVTIRIYLDNLDDRPSGAPRGSATCCSCCRWACSGRSRCPG